MEQTEIFVKKSGFFVVKRQRTRTFLWYLYEESGV